MAPLPDYVSGTITLTNGSAAFTGSGTGWLAASFREGDTILGIEDNPGVTYVIESITDNDAGTLTQPWDGPTGTYEYRMRYLADGQRVTAQARQLIELLGNGNLQALAGLSGTPNTLAMFTGAGAMVEVARTDLVSGANYDVQVDTLPDRDAYDTQPEGFAVLVSDMGDGRAAIFSRVEGGGWSDAAYVTGPSITLDVGSVTAAPFGSAPDVTLTSVPGGYELDFDLPESATFQSGTITTLDPGEDATFDLVPVTGGYQLDLGVPRGPTGDIDGVTSFWHDRITVDETAEAARTGLELVKQSAALDHTAGRLLQIGSFGIGANVDLRGTVYEIGTPEDVYGCGFVTGLATSVALGIDGGFAYGALVVNSPFDGGSASHATHRIFLNGGKVYTQRAVGSATWGPWHEGLYTSSILAAANIPADLPASQAYRQGNILAAVGLSGGVPSGGIIEQGANANGKYVRFANGTMWCFTPTSATLSMTTAMGNLYRSATLSDTTYVWTFPALFSEVGGVLASVTTRADAWANPLAITNEGCQISGFCNISRTDEGVAGVAVGAWN